MDKAQSVALAALVAVAACAEKKTPPADNAGAPPARVITLTPSATRLVAAVGALDRLVATDRFSDDPPAVKRLPRVGDFLAPNVEAIAKLEPDLVVCDAVQSKARASLETLGIAVLSIEMHSVADVRREVQAVADRLGVGPRGAEVRAAIDRAIDEARARARDRAESPRVLWVMDRQPGALAEVVAAGPGSFASELVEITGARNAVTGSVRYPKLSREALLKVDAEIVIDASGAAAESIAPWQGGAWRAVAAPTDLATPGPEIVAAIGRVESMVFGARRKSGTAPASAP